ncbi:MAG TPA: hypothetical protein VF781_02015 [Solirubrobacteraceae bacterium]
MVRVHRHGGIFARAAGRVVTSGPAFLVGLLVEIAVFAGAALAARRERRRSR